MVNEHVLVCIMWKNGRGDRSSTNDYAHYIFSSVTYIMHMQGVRASISDQATPRLMVSFEVYHINRLKEIIGLDICSQ